MRQSPEQLPSHMPKRKAAQRAGQAAASLMAAEDGRDEDGNPLPSALANSMAVADDFAMADALVLESADGGAPINFTRQIPDGMKQSADNPQVHLRAHASSLQTAGDDSKRQLPTVCFSSSGNPALHLLTT